MYNKITSVRNFLGLFLLVSLLSMTANAQTVILSEDFVSASAGDNTTTGGSGTAWTGNANFVVDPVNSKAYQAGGAVKLGTGTLAGFITSAPLDLSQDGGTFTVTFDVKGWTTVEGDIKITVTGLPEQTVTYTAIRTSTAFDTKTVTFTGGTANSTIRIETTAKRAFIDNVIVTTVPPTLGAPVATVATAVDHDSFVANWQAVTGATGYRLDVSGASDFSSFVTGYNNLAVSGTSQEVSGLPSTTTFYYRVRAMQGASTSADSNVITALTTIAAPVATDATEIENDAFTANWQVVTGASGYRLDVSTASDFSSFVGVYNDFAVTGTSQEITGLTSNTTYYFRVRAVNGTVASQNSNIEDVTTDCGPFTLPALTSDEYCPGSTVADLPLADTQGYQWFATETGGNALASTDVLITDTYYLMQTINNCESDRVSYAVNVVIVEAPVYAEPEIEVCNEGTVADITPQDSGYKFYTNQTGGTALASDTELVNGFYYVSKTVGDCESTRTEIEVEIEIPLVPTGAADQDFTAGQTLDDLVVTADEVLVWYAESSLTTELDPTTPLMDNITYYAVNLDEPCMSAPLAVTAHLALGTSAFGMSGLVTYPNPVRDVFTVSYSETITAVTVYNMLSQAVANANYNAASVQVNMSGLAAGTYFVKVVSGAESKTIKVVKQ